MVELHRATESADVATVALWQRDDGPVLLRSLATLFQANRTLVHATSEPGLLQDMCRVIAESGDYPLAWYGRRTADEQRTVAVAAVAGPAAGYADHLAIRWDESALGLGPRGRAIREGRTVVFDSGLDDPQYAPWRERAQQYGLTCSISLPVRVHGEVDGALMVYAREPHSFDGATQELMENLADDLGYGIARIRDGDELDRARAATEADRRRLQAILDSLIDPFILLDAVRDEAGRLVDLEFVDANHAAARYNRIPREELVGSRLLARWPGQLEHGPLRQYFHTIETGEPTLLDDFTYDNEQVGAARRYDIRATRAGDGIALTWRDVTERYEATRLVQESERRYRLLAENSSDVVFLADHTMHLTWVSASAEAMLGWRPEAMVGWGMPDFVHPDDVGDLRREVTGAARTHRQATVRYRARRADGSYVWVSASGRDVVGADGEFLGRVVSMREIEDQVRAEEELAAREAQYHLLAENASDIVWQIGPEGTVRWSSESVRSVLGWALDDVLGRVGVDLVHPEDRPRAVAARDEATSGGTVHGDFRVACADGSYRWMALTIRPVAKEDGTWRVLALRDVHDEVLARQELAHVVGHDPLTGLATRQTMQKRIELLAGSLRPGRVRGVLCVGVDGLRAVNDALTYSGGDLVLERIAARITEAVGDADRVGRNSGDEFVVLVPDLASGFDAAVVAETLLAAARGTLTVARARVEPTVSIGITTGQRDSDPERLLRDAALAMRAAKAQGRDRWSFPDQELALEAQRRLAAEAEVRDALAAAEFVPWLQPIVALPSGTVTGYEALARRVRSDGSVSAPNDFLPVAERSGLVTELDAAMLDASIAWLTRLPPHQYVAVNVSPATLALPGFADRVLEPLGRHAVRPSRLHLEVTETTLLTVTGAMREDMQRLQALGIRWYVDDFGTGYSSVSHLRDLPIGGLKLDRSFSVGIREGDPRSAQLAQALVGLAEGLELDTVAEGVEGDDEAAVLAAQGWTHAQGWRYGRPAPGPVG